MFENNVIKNISEICSQILASSHIHLSDGTVFRFNLVHNNFNYLLFSITAQNKVILFLCI